MERQKTAATMSDTGLAQVLSQVRAGDADAWGELYRRYAPAIFRFCRRLIPAREDAEDATTGIFMKVRQKLGTYDSSRPFTVWLYKVASNHCWDTLRRRRIRQDLETGDVDAPPLEHPDLGQLERLQAEHTSKEVRTGLARLPRSHKDGAGAAIFRGHELRGNSGHAGSAARVRRSAAAARAASVARRIETAKVTGHWPPPRPTVRLAD
jgi:RNA polymerase sigma factor (sigma-70 family)